MKPKFGKGDIVMAWQKGVPLVIQAVHQSSFSFTYFYEAVDGTVYPEDELMNMHDYALAATPTPYPTLQHAPPLTMPEAKFSVGEEVFVILNDVIEAGIISFLGYSKLANCFTYTLKLGPRRLGVDEHNLFTSYAAAEYFMSTGKRCD